MIERYFQSFKRKKVYKIKARYQSPHLKTINPLLAKINIVQTKVLAGNKYKLIALNQSINQIVWNNRQQIIIKPTKGFKYLKFRNKIANLINNSIYLYGLEKI